MNPEDVKFFIEKLWQTGELLVTTSYKLAYKKALFYGGSDLVVAAFFLILTVTCASFFRTEANNEDSDDGSFAAFLFVMTLVFSLLFLTFSYCGAKWLVNPELGAVKILIDIATKGTW